MFSFRVPKSHSPDHSAFLQKLVVALKRSDDHGEAAVAAAEGPELPACEADAELSGLRALLAEERARAAQRRLEEMRLIERKVMLIAEQRRSATLSSQPLAH
jgi:hypothetical protein